MPENRETCLEALIGEIAIKHGIAVDRHDPILILHTLNARLLDDSEKTQQALLTQFKVELEELSRRWGDETTRKAERIVNASLSATSEAMTRHMEDGAKQAATAIQREVGAAVETLSSVVRIARWSTLLTGAVMTLAALGLYWLTCP